MSVVAQQLKKGVLEIIVLSIIKEDDVYGYDLIKKIEADSESFFSIKEGSLYPILYRLEDKKMIESYQKSFEGERKVPRKYYQITRSGQEYLEEMLEEWHSFYRAVNRTLGF